MTAIPEGWPCIALNKPVPAVADRQSNPTADEILPQVMALTPRGSAWGTDEAGDGRGASPVMRQVWRSIAAWVADLNARDFDASTQTFPSAISWTLPDWETEYGLPDPCFSRLGGFPARLGAVRSRFTAVGGQSPAYFVCLATSLGYDVRLEEFQPFRFGRSSFGGPSGRFMDPRARHVWRMRVTGTTVSRFRFGGSSFGRDPFLTIPHATDLECTLQRLKPAQTTLIFAYGA